MWSSSRLCAASTWPTVLENKYAQEEGDEGRGQVGGHTHRQAQARRRHSTGTAQALAETYTMQLLSLSETLLESVWYTHFDICQACIAACLLPGPTCLLPGPQLESEALPVGIHLVKRLLNGPLAAGHVAQIRNLKCATSKAKHAP